MSKKIILYAFAFLLMAACRNNQTHDHNGESHGGHSHNGSHQHEDGSTHEDHKETAPINQEEFKVDTNATEHNHGHDHSNPNHKH